ncbi:MAG: cysteine peptidase family C39 domain-containing protein [Planctomycetaceae bacterium]
MSEESAAWRSCLDVGRSAFQILRHVVIICVLSVLTMSAGRASADEQTETVQQLRELDVFCGPRCLEFVLEYYGQKETFTDLVREIQWPDVERGCSMLALKTSLGRRDVYSVALRRSPGTILDWNMPAIVHLHRNGDSPLGHYVVWLPSSTSRTTRIWNGIHGLQEVPIDEFLSEMSGVVLLTSPAPVEDCSSVFVRSTRFGRFVSGPCLDWFMVMFPSLGSLGLYFLCHRGNTLVHRTEW